MDYRVLLVLPDFLEVVVQAVRLDLAVVLGRQDLQELQVLLD